MLYWVNKIKKNIYGDWFLGMTLDSKNYLDKNIRFTYWQFFFLGFYFDEFFARGLRQISHSILMLPSYFFLDKFFSYWIGAGFFKRLLNLFGNFFFIERLDFYFYFLIILLFIFNFIYIYILFSFI